jgi:hypothetical protein
MAPGLPGTGIGGMFYFLIAVLMPLREVGHWLSGRVRRPRWGFIAVTLGLVGAIIASIWGEMALINAALLRLQDIFQVDFGLEWAGLGKYFTARQARIVAGLAAVASLFTLSVVYVSVRVIGYFCARDEGVAIRMPAPVAGRPATIDLDV